MNVILRFTKNDGGEFDRELPNHDIEKVLTYINKIGAGGNCSSVAVADADSEWLRDALSVKITGKGMKTFVDSILFLDQWQREARDA